MSADTEVIELPETVLLDEPLFGDVEEAELAVGNRRVPLTNLQKPFWPELGIMKGNLIEYYLRMGEALLPHLRDRAMVMKRYPNGWQGKHFFMKRAPSHRPEWIETCRIDHRSGNVIDFPMIQDMAALAWVINLGCIDLNQWYARCDDVNTPDYLHFDLDPVPGAKWETVLEAALIVRDALDAVGLPSYAKTTGSRGFHVYIPIVRGIVQKQVWTFAKAFAREQAKKHPDVLTAEYRVKQRPEGRVLVDYNQNAWGSTLASVYSVRPRPRATVSMPVTWDEVEAGVRIEDFTVFNAPARVREVGDLFGPLLVADGRIQLEDYL
jgi:bifunctional non-homologous end joining protein LigD